MNEILEIVSKGVAKSLEQRGFEDVKTSSTEHDEYMSPSKESLKREFVHVEWKGGPRGRARLDIEFGKHEEELIIWYG